MRKEIEKMIEARRWSVKKVLERNPGRMMRIAVEVREQKLVKGLDLHDPDRQRRVLVRVPPLIPRMVNYVLPYLVLNPCTQGDDEMISFFYA